MWEKIFNLALSNGIWAVLFLALLVYQLRDSRSREAKYQQTIETLGKSLDVINDVKEDVEEIKGQLHTLNQNTKESGDEKQN